MVGERIDEWFNEFFALNVRESKERDMAKRMLRKRPCDWEGSEELCVVSKRIRRDPTEIHCLKEDTRAGLDPCCHREDDYISVATFESDEAPLQANEDFQPSFTYCGAEALARTVRLHKAIEKSGSGRNRSRKRGLRKYLPHLLLKAGVRLLSLRFCMQRTH